MESLRTPSHGSSSSSEEEDEQSQDEAYSALIRYEDSSEQIQESERLQPLLTTEELHSPPIIHVYDGHLIRSKMFADFFEYHLPKNQNVQHGRTTSYLRVLMSHPTPSPLLQCGIETLCLGFAAKKDNDPNLLHAARQSYGRMLGMLQTAVASSWRSIGVQDGRELVASVSLMTHLDHPLVDSRDAGDSWATHLDGASKLLKSLGPKYLTTTLDLDRGLARHVLSNGTLLAIARRKASSFMDYWSSAPSTGWTQSVDTFGHLPALLEQTDLVLATSPYDLDKLSVILERLHSIKYFGLMLWSEEDIDPEIMVTAPEHFNLSIEEQRFATSSRSIAAFFAPKDEPYTFRVTARLLYLTILESTILRIWRFAPDLVPFPARLRKAESHIFGLALKMCQTLLLWTAGHNMAHVLSYRMYLKLARNVFEQQGKVKELSWCNACLIANKMRLKRIRASVPPTLCRIEDVLHGIAEAGRYKAAFRLQAFQVNAQRTSTKMDD